ncbi:hypothetical protein LP420_31425 [Massilia sp. B-10]|nr:hypothetical protein LP420_31425 [Massilia sp. B-10]UUZ53266.1 hypothetical protein LP419_30955 [Massilia sp. H-1]
MATSVAAFVGRALRGPSDDAVVINSYGDFERIFGGLWVDSTLGFAVRDFYLNGGAQAIIVRLFSTDTADGAAPAKTPLTVGNFTLEAAYEGSWGGNLRFVVDTQVSDQVALQMGVAKTALFNMTISEVGANGVAVQVEQFRNLTVIASAPDQQGAGARIAPDALARQLPAGHAAGHRRLAHGLG